MGLIRSCSIEAYCQLFLYMFVCSLSCPNSTHLFTISVFWLSRLMQVGEEFCGSKSELLQESIKRQSVNYFKNYHR